MYIEDWEQLLPQVYGGMGERKRLMSVFDRQRHVVPLTRTSAQNALLCRSVSEHAAPLLVTKAATEDPDSKERRRRRIVSTESVVDVGRAVGSQDFFPKLVLRTRTLKTNSGKKKKTKKPPQPD